MSISLTHKFSTKYKYDKLSYLVIIVWVILAIVDSYQLYAAIEAGHTKLITYKIDDIVIHSALAWISFLLMKSYRTLSSVITILGKITEGKPDKDGVIHINIDEKNPLKNVVDE